MKKRFLPILILCFALICSAACSVTGGKDGEQSGTASLTPDAVGVSGDTGTARDDLTHEVPYVLRFDSFGKIAELREIADKSSDEIEKYLDSSGYNMNGLSSKEDIADFFNKTAALNMLHLNETSGYKLDEISYYADYGYVMSTYSSGGDIVRFICYIEGENKADESLKNSDKKDEGSAEAGKITVCGDTVPLFKVEEKDTPFALFGGLDTSNSHITVLLSDKAQANEEGDNIGLYIIAASLENLIKQEGM